MFSKSVRIFIITALLLLGVVAAANASEPTRIPTNRAALANVFQDQEGYSVWRYNPETKQGEFQFFIDYDDVAEAKQQVIATGENLLLDSSGDIEIWALTEGHCQINSPMVDGADYTFAFDC